MFPLGSRLRDATRFVLASLCLAAPAGCGSHAPSAREAHPLTPCVSGRCAEGYSCRYEHPRDGGAAQESVCRPEVGRCNSNIDCRPNQACVRPTERVGRCTQRPF